MIRIAKYVLYLIIAGGVVLLFWFLPKYSYVQKNPGYCANLSKHLYYCGTDADLKSMFDSGSKSVPSSAQTQVQNGLQDAASAELKTQFENQTSQ